MLHVKMHHRPYHSARPIARIVFGQGGIKRKSRHQGLTPLAMNCRRFAAKANLLGMELKSTRVNLIVSRRRIDSRSL